MTSNAVQGPQTPGALRVAAAWARLRCCASSTMTRHRLDRRALHPGPRRSQRDPRDFYHGLLSLLRAVGDERVFSESTICCFHPEKKTPTGLRALFRQGHPVVRRVGLGYDEIFLKLVTLSVSKTI